MQNKRYRLLKWYPSLSTSWEVGMEVGQGDRQGCCANFSPCDAKYPQWQISYDQVVNFPEFWEEIVEKDYEILMYRGKINTDIYFDNPEYFSRLNSDWEIYSIHRKSDGVEFKIGDKVYWNWAFAKNKYFTIKSFNIIEDKLRFNTVEESGQNFIFELISKEYNLQHYKEPILTTEDGYECTLDDRVFGVLPKANWQTNYYGKKGVPVFKLFNPEGKRWNPSSEWLWFKTKENAEKYIYENKPEFSRKDLYRLTELLKSHTFSYWDTLIKSFK